MLRSTRVFAMAFGIFIESMVTPGVWAKDETHVNAPTPPATTRPAATGDSHREADSPDDVARHRQGRETREIAGEIGQLRAGSGAVRLQLLG